MDSPEDRRGRLVRRVAAEMAELVGRTGCLLSARVPLVPGRSCAGVGWWPATSPYSS